MGPKGFFEHEQLGRDDGCPLLSLPACGSRLCSQDLREERRVFRAQGQAESGMGARDEVGVLDKRVILLEYRAE